jgi:hypothetical protein
MRNRKGSGFCEDKWISNSQNMFFISYNIFNNCLCGTSIII